MSGASSLRNAVKRVTHKERSQPSWRKNAGFLEKHKDYIVRAKDYHNKQDHLKKLKTKASEKNADEFYFKMNKSSVIGGVHKIQENSSLDMDTVKLLKTQDMGYIVHKKCIDERKVEKLKKNLHFIGEGRPKTHKLFVDTPEDIESFDAAKYLDTVPELVDRTFNRPRTAAIDEYASTCSVTKKALSKVLSERKKSYIELQRRVTRVNKIERVRQHLQTQRDLMGKGAKRKVKEEGEDGAPPVYKWKRQRSS